MQPGVTWIRVEKPTFDLVGLILGSLKLTGFVVLIALALGIGLGLALILRRRSRPPRSVLEPVSLHLDG
jgi:ABC-type phosphate transport system permease subunit